MTGPAGNSEFYFPSTSVFPQTKPRGTLKTRENKTLCFPVGPVIKCLKIPQEIWKQRQFKYFLCHAGIKSSTWIFLAIERPLELFAVQFLKAKCPSILNPKSENFYHDLSFVGFSYCLESIYCFMTLWLCVEMLNIMPSLREVAKKYINAKCKQNGDSNDGPISSTFTLH